MDCSNLQLCKLGRRMLLQIFKDISIIPSQRPWMIWRLLIWTIYWYIVIQKRNMSVMLSELCKVFWRPDCTSNRTSVKSMMQLSGIWDCSYEQQESQWMPIVLKQLGIGAARSRWRMAGWITCLQFNSSSDFVTIIDTTSPSILRWQNP